MVDESDDNDSQSMEEMRDQEGVVREDKIEGIPIRRHSSSSERKSFSHLWLVSYSDFMTIMMIFFLVLYGYTVMAKSALIHQNENKMSYSDFSKTISQIKGPLGESLQVQEDVSKVVILLPDKILFPSGQSALNQLAKRTLEDVANSLKLVEGDIVVEGHTDNVPIAGGRYRSNWELSAARSFSVVEELARQGISQTRLAAWGFGENRPLVPNKTNDARAKNRRIEVVLLKKIAKNIKEEGNAR